MIGFAYQAFQSFHWMLQRTQDQYRRVRCETKARQAHASFERGNDPARDTSMTIPKTAMDVPLPQNSKHEEYPNGEGCLRSL
ncbi:MAG: hypothetical protein WDM86_21920 [Rhizomicrobium sp.]